MALLLVWKSNLSVLWEDILSNSQRKSIKMQQCIKRFCISYLYEAQHVSGDTLPIIRSLKLHYQHLVLHMWRVVWRVISGRCQVESRVQQLHIQQLSTYSKPEVATVVLSSWWWAMCRPKHVELQINMK